MPDWEERLSDRSHPSLRLEHVVRYRAAQQIVLGSDVWCDLGCGTGIASAAAFTGFDGRAVLVDVVPEVVDEAVRRIPGSVGVVADVATEAGLRAVRKAAEGGTRGCITCFEVLEHVEHLTRLVAELKDLAAVDGWTIVLSVPNDAFWTIENPYHLTTWSDSAVAELTTLLPEPYVVALQVSLSGSCIARGPARFSVDAEIVEGGIPTQFLVAFGPRCEDLTPTATVAAADLDAQRTWERQREADLAYFKARVDGQ
jgi:SAM-dependent methyltransferase